MTPDRQTLLRHLSDDLQRSCDELLQDPSPDAPFSELKVDSLSLAEFVARVEQRFRVAIPDEEWRALGSLNQVADWLEPRLPR
ncbi:MAG: acyl carrier protein [Deltaproteobacteria bacterium]|nr:acyl carrier protein [Deltaproteobacteria bacterium]